MALLHHSQVLPEWAGPFEANKEQRHMIERNKQVDDQEKKLAKEKADHEHPHKDVKDQSGQQHAGKATDPETMKDKGYVERIEEKTSKH